MDLCVALAYGELQARTLYLGGILHMLFCLRSGREIRRPLRRRRQRTRYHDLARHSPGARVALQPHNFSVISAENSQLPIR